MTCQQATTQIMNLKAMPATLPQSQATANNDNAKHAKPLLAC